MKRLIILLIVIMAAACKKDTFNGSEKFNSIGTKYTYSIRDSATNQTTIVSVRILKSIEISGKQMNVWVYDYPGSRDTNYVYSNRDSIIFYDHTKTTIITAYYLPLVIGRKWQNYHYTDTCYVVNKVKITSGNKVYNDVYEINEKAGGFNYSLNKTEWFLPGTGMIRMSKTERNLGPREHSDWELVKIE